MVKSVESEIMFFWQMMYTIEDITVNAGMNEINLVIRSTKRWQCLCGICYRKARGTTKVVVGDVGVV